MKKYLSVLALSLALVACGKSLNIGKEKVEKTEELVKINLELAKVEGKVTEEVQNVINNVNDGIKKLAEEVEKSSATATKEMPFEVSSKVETTESKEFGTKSIIFDTYEFIGGANGANQKTFININTKDNTLYDLSKVLSDEKKAEVVNSINEAIKSKQNFDGSALEVFGDVFVEDFDKITWYFKDDFAIAHFNATEIGPRSAGEIEFSFSSASLLK